MKRAATHLPVSDKENIALFSNCRIVILRPLARQRRKITTTGATRMCESLGVTWMGHG